MALSKESERNGKNKPAPKGERHISRPYIYPAEKELLLIQNNYILRRNINQ